MIPSFFRAYTEEQYRPYAEVVMQEDGLTTKGMYTNLDYRNVILAARVEDKVLTGKELVEWYEKECHNDPQVLIQKLGLSVGPRKAEFDFGERAIKQELVTPHLDRVTYFKQRMADSQEDMMSASLILERRRLLEKKIELEQSSEQYVVGGGLARERIEVLEETNQRLSQVEEVLQGWMTPEEMRREEMRTTQELQEEIRQMQQQELRMYSVELTILQEYMGISEADVDNAIKQKIRETMGISEENVGTDQEQSKGKKRVLTSAQKSAQSALIGEIKGKIEDKELLGHIYSGRTLSDDEKSKLSGIVPESVLENYQKKMEVEITAEERRAKKEERVEQVFSKTKSNPEQYSVAQREALATMIYPEVSEEEVISLLDEKHHLMVLAAEVAETDPPEKKALEDLSLAERRRLEQEVRLNKLQRAQAEITIGINTQAKINEMRETISKTPKADIACARFVYGNDWYLCVDEEGKIMEEFIDESLPRESKSRETFQDAKKEFIENAEEITAKQVAQKTEDVSEEKKKSVIKRLAERIRPTKKLKKERTGGDDNR